MNTKKELIPQLRFPEYTHANSFWLENLVGDSIKTLAPPKKLQSNDYKETGKYPIIDQSQEFICGYSDDDSALINKNSKELIVFGDHTCVFKFIDFPFIQGADGIKIFEPKRADEIDVRYLYQYLLSSRIESKEYKRHFSELKEKLFLYPKTINEQTKIADCLFSIDSNISSINEKVEKIKAHKKSLMQKMFPQKGQTAPVFRFPEFNTEWKKVTLGDIFVERREHSTITDDLPQLSFTIEEGAIYPNNKKTNKRDFLINDKDNKKYLVTYIDDIIYNPANVIYGAIHKNSLCNGVVSPIYKIFSTSQDASFMEYIVRMPEFIQKMSTYMEGTVLKLRTLKPESFLKMEVFIAPSLAEQRKIAECLSSIDKTIEYYTKKSVILEQHKKGLMQQLFPKLKEL